MVTSSLQPRSASGSRKLTHNRNSSRESRSRSSNTATGGILQSCLKDNIEHFASDRWPACDLTALFRNTKILKIGIPSSSGCIGERSHSDDFLDLKSSASEVVSSTPSDKKKMIESSSTPSDKNPSIKKVESNPSDSATDSDRTLDSDYKFDPNMDPNKIRRILANRESAKRSRRKKQQYVAHLENNRNSLEAEIALLSTKVRHHERECLRLNVERTTMEKKLTRALAEEALKDAQIKSLKDETKRLNQLLAQLHEKQLQQQQKHLELQQQHQQLQQQQQQFQSWQQEQLQMQMQRQQEQQQQQVFGFTPLVDPLLECNTMHMASFNMGPNPISDPPVNLNSFSSLDPFNSRFTSTLDPLFMFNSLSPDPSNAGFNSMLGTLFKNPMNLDSFNTGLTSIEDPIFTLNSMNLDPSNAGLTPMPDPNFKSS
ncbi:PREDICTED: probable serine/threonine-protein kinase cdc7 [Nelumbo nucifera]|uniref:BZIP domain-containing protein n=2 Tax=Nelumbo nucifera TaxID=4432 RepID=A0A822XIA3_NELNU|nr:PREDICTED: probable serine/threonine-protein kinase cdc7 [Nelumbo nucifera]DAD18525.1 TPA_asm: hypothetical protein HUJ06_019988 [Nelumbo nucifera]